MPPDGGAAAGGDPSLDDRIAHLIRRNVVMDNINL